MRIVLAIAIVASMVISASGQDCVNGVCRLRNVMPRLLRVEQPVVAVAVQPTGCGGQAVMASCAGSEATVYRRAPLRTLHTRLHTRRLARRSGGCGGVAVVASGCGGVDMVQPTVVPDVVVPSVIVPTVIVPDVIVPISYQPYGNSLYQIALQSATYRAARGIRGHSSIEMGHNSGVGWSSFNPRPTTCLGNTDSSFAVVRGIDGWYSTVVR